MGHQIIQGYVQDVLPTLEEDLFSMCLTDAPYHLTQASRGGSPRKPGSGPYGRHRLGQAGFAGATWDGGDIAFKKETWENVLRVMKPGAYLLAFGGSRTFHRLTCAIEDAGFTIMNCVSWLYSQGMQKGVNISKAMDKKAGAKRKVVGQYQPPGMSKPWNLKNANDDRTVPVFASSRNNLDITAPATEMAKQWDGYGTSLVPAWEPIIMAMKPLDGTYIQNAEKWGVAGLNIDGSRIGTTDVLNGGSGGLFSHARDDKPYGDNNGYIPSPLGRWPKNVILDEGTAGMLDEMVPGASRFYYCAKPSTREKNLGLSDGVVNGHETVKPIRLTQYLATLGLPPRSVSGQPRRLLVPFAGVMSEAIGGVLAGWDEVVAIEKDEGYVKIGRERLAYWTARRDEGNRNIFD